MAKPKISVTFNAVDKVSKPVKGMNRKVTGFSKNASRSFRSVGQSINRMRGLLVGAGAAIVTGKIAQSVNEFTKLGDEIGKTSRQLGIGVEALQEFRFAAERQGVSTENLEKSMKAMNNRLGLLRNGQGQLNTLLKDTNPELREQLQTTDSSEEAFMLLMEAMNEASSAAERTALAQAAFSSSGRELVRISEAGTEGIKDLREEARATGNVMSEEATRGSEKFQDAMTNLKATMQGVRNTALTPLIHQLTPLIQRTADWVAQNKELIQLRIEQTITTIKNVVQTLAAAWKSGLIPAIIAGVTAFKAISTAVQVVQTLKIAMAGLNLVFAASPIGLLITGIAALVAGLVWLEKKFGIVSKAAKKAWGVIKGVGEFFGIGEGDNSGRQGVAGASLGGGGLVSANQGVSETRSFSESRSTVDINVGGLPAGSTTRQRGKAPGVNLNTGYGLAMP